MTTFVVSSTIVFYSLLMNSTILFDQLRSTVPTVRREQIVPISLFRFVLDSCVISAHDLINEITPLGQRITYRAKLKQRVVMQLDMEHMTFKKSHQTFRAFDGDINERT